MKKILYIFLAHVVVLGSLWIWRDSRDADTPMVRDNYEQALFLATIKTDSSGLEMLICIDRDNLQEIVPGQTFSIPMTVYADEREIDLDGFSRKDMRACCRVVLNETGSECEIFHEW